MDDDAFARFRDLMKRLGRIYERAATNELIDDYVLALGDIDTRRLEQAMELGQRSWTRFPKPAEIRAVSERISQARGKRREYGDCEFGCSEAGLIVLDAEGNAPEGNAPKSDYLGHTYCKPCPIHRPQGVVAPGPEYVKPGPRVGQAEAQRINVYRLPIRGIDARAIL